VKESLHEKLKVWTAGSATVCSTVSGIIVKRTNVNVKTLSGMALTLKRPMLGAGAEPERSKVHEHL